MLKRLELHEILCAIINITEPNGDRHVYFQPPESLKMRYPAIRYRRSRVDNRYANNAIYSQSTGYEVIVIDHDPDSEYSKKVSILPRCRFDRSYTVEGLNHDVYTIY